MTTQDHIPTELPSAEIIAAVNIYTATPSAAPSQVDEVRRSRAALERIAGMTDIEADFDGFEAREIARQALASSSGG